MEMHELVRRTGGLYRLGRELGATIDVAPGDASDLVIIAAWRPCCLCDATPDGSPIDGYRDTLGLGPLPCPCGGHVGAPGTVVAADADSWTEPVKTLLDALFATQCVDLLDAAPPHCGS